MCKAFSAVITKNGKVYYKAGINSHADLINEFKDKDTLIRVDKDPKNNTIALIEITPKEDNYLNPAKNNWEFDLDKNIKPDWWMPTFEGYCWDAWKKWKKEIYPFINLKETKNPINPIKIKHSNRVSKEEFAMLKNWDSVRASVRDSVWDSVWDSVRDSVRASVWDSVGASVWDSVRASVWDSVGASVWDSVWDSVRDSVWAYIGHLFLGIDNWKYTEKIKVKGYPFQPCVDLWKKGLVPSYDSVNKVWRIHLMCKKAKVIWQGKISDIK